MLYHHRARFGSRDESSARAAALHAVAEAAWLSSGHHATRTTRPGATYASLPEGMRSLLRNLRSDDIRDVRPFWC